MKKTYVELMACAGLLALAACSDSDKMAGVTEDDNALAQLSSSSLADSLSSSSPTLSSSGMGATPKFDLWNGVDGIAKVNTGNENLGYWYSFGDDAEGGMSLVKYPVELGNDYSGNSLEPVIEACEGLCGTIELNNPKATPWAGVGFAVAEDGSAADISAWGGMCITYASDVAMNVMLGVVTAGDSLNWASPYVSFPKTIRNASTLSTLMSAGSVVTRCAKWSDFKIPEWAASPAAQTGPVLSGEEASKQVHAVLFRFTGNSSQSVNFNIKGIGTYDENLPQWDTPVDQVPGKDVKDTSKNTNKDMSRCLWTGNDGEVFVNTGFESSEENGAGYWYDYADDPEGGMSTLVWPVEMDYPYIGLEAVIETCTGLCGEMRLDKGSASEAYVGLAFNVAGIDSSRMPVTADITDWGGICVTYTAEMDMQLVLSAIEDKRLPLEKSLEPVEKCYNWDDFGIASAKGVRSIKFEMRSSQVVSAKVAIYAVGKYSSDGACRELVPGSSLASSSSRSEIQSSSSSAPVVENCMKLSEYSDLWNGQGGDMRVNTGLGDTLNSAGAWSWTDFDSLKRAGVYEGEHFSRFNWPSYTERGDASVAEYCGGTCGTMDYVNECWGGVQFMIVGTNSNGLETLYGDVSDWGGLCVTYASELDLDVVLGDFKASDFVDISKKAKVTFPRQLELKTHCAKWSEFVTPSGESGDPTHLASILFLSHGQAGTQSKMNIVALGKYKVLNNVCSLEEDPFVAGRK